MGSDPRRAGRFETIGAWLHIWTPPRDVEVPPVPWRKLLAVGLPLLAVTGVAAWLIVDNASEDRERREAAAAREELERKKERAALLRLEQVAKRATIEPAPRPEMVVALERHVLSDALSRDLKRDVRRVECEPHPRSVVRDAIENDPKVKSNRYRCMAVTSDIPGRVKGVIGYPFLARIHYDTGALVWCKSTEIPGERLIPDPRTVVPPPRACL